MMLGVNSHQKLAKLDDLRKFLFSDIWAKGAKHVPKIGLHIVF